MQGHVRGDRREVAKILPAIHVPAFELAHEPFAAGAHAEGAQGDVLLEERGQRGSDHRRDVRAIGAEMPDDGTAAAVDPVSQRTCVVQSIASRNRGWESAA